MNEILSIEDEKFQELLAALKHSPHDINEERIHRAYKFAKKAHEGQFRVSGVPYICHPVEAAKMLADLGADEDTLVAGILHDVPEDTDYTIEDIENRFGKDVKNLVDALTKLSKVYYRHSMTDRQVMSLRKMFIETASDPRVVVIKLADRLHNMQTLQYLRPDKQQRIAQETLEIYAPLANLYGIFQIRREMEDYCFMYLLPAEYARIKAYVHDQQKNREQFVQDTIRVIEKSLKKKGIEAEIEGRPKHYYSIYQKMVRDRKMLQDIYDYFAIRIVTKKTEDCYRILGIVHDLFKPKPSRFKDYIALPKPNGYQSLHTTVVGLQGQHTEIQIRTEEMNENAEYGVAAHVYYKTGHNRYLADSIAQLKKFSHPEQFIQNLQDDVLKSRIFVFSPKGDVVYLPEGATCLDYIYSLDLPVEGKAFRVIVNNRSYSLVGELQSGDRIEVIYYQSSEHKGPERWWLGHVKTAKAKKTIQEFFEKTSFEHRVHLGESLMQQALDRENKGLVYQLPQRLTTEAATFFDAKNFEDLLAQIGSGNFEADDVYQVMFPKIELGWSSAIYHFVYGFLKRYQPNRDRLKYRIQIVVEAFDRVGLLGEVVQHLYELKIPILRMKGYCYPSRGRKFRVNLRGSKVAIDTNMISRDIYEVELEGHEELIALFDRLEKIPGIIRVYRLFRPRQFAFVTLSLFTGAYFLLHPLWIRALSHTNAFENKLFSYALVYSGVGLVLILVIWLRSMANKTFPHLEETKYFWPLAFGITSISVSSLFVTNEYFGLGLDPVSNLIFSVALFAFLFWAFYSHEQRRKRHMNRLKDAQKGLQED